jgi:tetratricopeptide (TPR) repeat protein
MNRSIANRHVGNPEAAVADAKASVRYFPFEPQTYILLAQAWMTMGADEALEGVGDDEKAKKRSGFLDNARRALHEGIDKSPSPNLTLYLTLAEFYASLGTDQHNEEALIWADRACREFPADLRSRLYKSILLIQMKHYDAAGNFLLDLWEKRPAWKENPYIVGGLGFCFFQKGGYEQSVEFTEKCLGIDKTNKFGLLTYRRLMEKGIPVNVDLSGLEPSVILPGRIKPPQLGDLDELPGLQTRGEDEEPRTAPPLSTRR